MVSLGRYSRSCNVLDHPSCKIFVSNKTAKINLSVLRMKSRINESKTLAKDIPCNFRCKFGFKKFKSKVE